MANGQGGGGLMNVLADPVLKNLGALVLLLIFMVGVYLFLGETRVDDTARYKIDRDYEHQRFKARQDRETRLIALIERQHNALEKAAIDMLTGITDRMVKMEGRSQVLETSLVRLGIFLDQQGIPVDAADAKKARLEVTPGGQVKKKRGR